MIITEKQKEFIRNATHRYNLKIGARRCGKTYLDILFTIPNRLLERKDLDGLNVIFGVSKGTIERNVLQPLREIYGKDLVGFINSQNIANLFGQEVYCLGTEKISQVSKIQGTSIKYAYGDEMAKWNKEVFIMIQGSLDKPYSCLDGALNPENKNHWLKKDFLDVIKEKGLDVYTQYYTIFDNPFLPKDFVENLCKEYKGTVYYNRLILGQWCDAEGLIFRQIANDDKRFITTTIQYNSIISIGIDWGGNKSKHSITATKISRDFKSVQVLKASTMKATGTNTKQVFRWIINFIKEIQDKYGTVSFIFADSAEQVLNNSLNGELRANEINLVVQDSLKIEIKNRIELWNRLLNLDKISFIEGQCQTLIEALQTALYDEKAKDDRWIDDGETSDIDSLDSFNYSFEYWFEEISYYLGKVA
ncbi:MAG: phage terminase large subunit [Clostridia bacterium]